MLHWFDYNFDHKNDYECERPFQSTCLTTFIRKKTRLDLWIFTDRTSIQKIIRKEKAIKKTFFERVTLTCKRQTFSSGSILGFRLKKQSDYFKVNFDHFWNKSISFKGSLGREIGKIGSNQKSYPKLSLFKSFLNHCILENLPKTKGLNAVDSNLKIIQAFQIYIRKFQRVLKIG